MKEQFQIYLWNEIVIMLDATSSKEDFQVAWLLNWQEASAASKSVSFAQEFSLACCNWFC